MTASQPRIELVSQTIEHGVTQIDLLRDATPVSRVFIIPLTLTIGIARVRVDGIGGVWTEGLHSLSPCLIKRIS